MHVARPPARPWQVQCESEQCANGDGEEHEPDVLLPEVIDVEVDLRKRIEA